MSDNQLVRPATVSMPRLTVVCTGLSPLTVIACTTSGSRTHTPVVSNPTMPATRRASASVAWGNRTGTTLPNPASPNFFNNTAASVAAPELQVTPIVVNRKPCSAATLSARRTAFTTSAQMSSVRAGARPRMSSALWSTVAPSASLPSTRTRPTVDGVKETPSTASTFTPEKCGRRPNVSR
ncbi:hypothetical protein GO011_22115 [Mycobacterium sp. 20091114027_K0903767]|nr:hypothetical protein [Mycobacterium sp. 20091114027_K0903767]